MPMTMDEQHDQERTRAEPNELSHGSLRVEMKPSRDETPWAQAFTFPKSCIAGSKLLLHSSPEVTTS